MPNTIDLLQFILSQHKNQSDSGQRLDLSDFDFKRLKEEKNDLNNLDLSFTVLNNTHLDDLNLSGANFSDSILNEVYFSGSLLSKANFTRTSLSGNFSDTDLSGAIFENLTFGGNLDLKGASFSTDSFYALFKELKENSIHSIAEIFMGSILQEVNFSLLTSNFQLDLSGLNLSNCDVQGANFSKMDLTTLHFENIKASFVQCFETYLSPKQLVEFYQGGARDFSQIILIGEVPRALRNFSFTSAQLSTQAIAYLVAKGWQNSLSIRMPADFNHEPFIDASQINLIEKLTAIQVTKSIEEKFYEAKARQNKFYSLQNLLSQLINSQNEPSLEWQVLPFVFCNDYTHYDLLLDDWMQSVMWEKELMFLDNLTAITQIESRLCAGKFLSHQEIADITLFFDLNSERIPSPPSSENLVQLLYSDLHTYIGNLNRDFVIKINFLETELSKWLIVYHKNNYFYMLNDDFFYVKNIKKIDSLMIVIRNLVPDSKQNLTVHHQVLNHEIVWSKLETEAKRLQNLDLSLGNLVIDNEMISRDLLYQLGATLLRNQSHSSPTSEINQPIHAQLDLSQERINNDVLQGKISISGEDYLHFVEKKIKFPDASFSVSTFLSLNRIFSKLHFRGDAEVKIRARKVNEIINHQEFHEFSELANQLEDYLDLSYRRIQRRVRTKFLSKRNPKVIDNFYLHPKAISVDQLEISKLYWELSLNPVSSEEVYLQLAELGYKYEIVPEIVKLTKDLKVYPGFKTYIFFTAAYKKINHWVDKMKSHSLTKSVFGQGMVGLFKSPFDIARIFKSGYDLKSELSEKEYRDNIATIFFSSSSLGQSTLKEIFDISEENLTRAFIVMIGIEMIYRGMSELEEDKKYSLTYSENLSAYLRAAFGFPPGYNLELLKYRINKINMIKDRAQEILQNNPETVFIAALGKLNIKRTSSIQPGEVHVEFNRFKAPDSPYLEVMADYAAIELYEKDPMSAECLSRLTPSIDENKFVLVCAPVFNYDAIYDPAPNNKKIHTLNYYCNNAFAVSHQVGEDLSNMTFIYDLSLQNSGRVATSKKSKKIFFL